VKPGTVTTIAGEILSSNVRTTRRAGFKLFEALVRDRSGSIRVVWPNQAFLRDVLQPHQQVVLFGAIEVRGGLQMTNPEYEIIRRAFPDAADPDAADEGDDTIHTGRIVPVYEKTGSVTTRMQRQLVHGALQRLPADVSDPLPAAVRAKRGLPDRGRALADAHFPPAGTPIETLNRFRSAAQVRLIFEEFFLFQLGLVLRKRRAEEEHKPHAIVVDDRVRESARRVLPFRLTSGQKQALKAIVDDMQRPQPMNRLLQGDVGAGKTIVALLASLVAMENGLQAAFMAPTEILAEQHYANLVRLLAGARFRVALLTGTLTATARREVYNEIASGAVHLVVGTHALVQDPVTFHALGLAVIDEQHRFGVLQRAGLRGKGLQPDVLVMTATPIPRTLALTTYGDMDVSVIPDLPPGRHPITTIAKPEGRREEVHAFVRGELEAGRQAYIIYPLVEESEKVDLKAATEMADTLQQEVFQAYRVALLHGRMKPDAKDRVMAAFARGELHVLVATTVVEVGVDVPNAAVMIVEHAERFGLSQLHQLRGRVGRGPHRSHCILLYQHPLSEPARDRLKAMTETTDGFEIAERDLAQRGPGDFFGTRQSGVPTLRVGDLLRDHQLMEDARREAVAALDAGDARELIGLVTGTWEKRFGLAGVG
jgi:ATP-dependent DNA helicase RecG